MNQIIIISFTFPPQYGIGGRRWAKFAKYFARKELSVEVFTSPTYKVGSPWVDDVSGVKIVEVESGFPRVVRFGVSSLLDKVKYRLELLNLRKEVNGNYYDHSSMWHVKLLPALKKADLSRTIIIASAGPFSYLNDLLSLKKEHLSLRLVADFRDPWTNNRTAFGYDSLSKKRLQFEKWKEAEVVKGFDLIVSVADPMTAYFQSLLPTEDALKCITIPNGYDPEETIENTLKIKKNHKLNVCFVGTLYGKTFDSIRVFIKSLEGYEETIQFRFCGDMNIEAHDLLKNQTNVELLGKLKAQEAKAIIAASDVCLLILTDDLTYSFSTKFCEYIQARKPIWIISKSGSTPDFVREHGIGFHSLPTLESIKQGLENIRTSFDTISYEGFNDSQFNLNTISEHYLNQLKKLTGDDISQM